MFLQWIFLNRASCILFWTQLFGNRTFCGTIKGSLYSYFKVIILMLLLQLIIIVIILLLLIIIMMMIIKTINNNFISKTHNNNNNNNNNYKPVSIMSPNISNLVDALLFYLFTLHM